MVEMSRPWDGVTVGDATEAPYNAGTEFSYLMAAAVGSQGTLNNGGVVRNYSSAANLAVSGIASPLQVEPGDAFVNGTHYNNSAALAVAIPTPAAGHTRIDRIVLRKSWAAQTIRVTVITGILDGAAPALTQTIGTTWDVPLAQAAITDAGVITLTDEREFLASGAGPVLLRKVTVTVASSSIIIDNIPQQYNHLKIYASLKDDNNPSAADILNFNGDVGNNYSYGYYGYVNGSGFGSGYTGPAAYISLSRVGGADSDPDKFASQELFIASYSKTDRTKQISGMNVSVDLVASTGMTHFGAWNVTSAITQIMFRCTGYGVGNTFQIGSEVSIYGIP